MGLNNSSSEKNYFAADYMLETVSYVYYLLFINTSYLLLLCYNATAKLDLSKNIVLLNSKNSSTTINSQVMDTQSAENWKGFSETVRQLPDIEDYKFWNWFAGVLDGDGNFDIRTNSNTKTRVLKQIRIKLHNRDIRILRRIQNFLHIGRILTDKKKPYSIYVVSRKDDMMHIINNINGLIRLKIPSFKEACILYNISFINPSYNIGLYDPYFSGLIDTDGSIVFNYTANRIECSLEFKYNEYTSKLNFDNTIRNSKPYVIKRNKSSSKSEPKHFSSIAFKFQNVNSMLFIYDYFMHNRLYCDIKFYRVSKIKPFMEIRKYKTCLKYSAEHKIYSNFVINWIKYENPIWYKIQFINKFLLYKDD